MLAKTCFGSGAPGSASTKLETKLASPSQFHGQRKLIRRIRHRGDVIEAGGELRAEGRVLIGLEAKHEVIRVEGLTIGPFEARAQFEGPGLQVRAGPAIGHSWDLRCQSSVNLTKRVSVEQRGINGLVNQNRIGGVRSLG